MLFTFSGSSVAIGMMISDSSSADTPSACDTPSHAVDEALRAPHQQHDRQKQLQRDGGERRRQAEAREQQRSGASVPCPLSTSAADARNVETT